MLDRVPLWAMAVILGSVCVQMFEFLWDRPSSHSEISSVVAGVCVRVSIADNLNTTALLWNLFLAWLPLVFAILVYDGERSGAAARPAASCPTAYQPPTLHGPAAL